MAGCPSCSLRLQLLLLLGLIVAPPPVWCLADKARIPAFSMRLKACAKGCERHGNCNGETGECECPFGFGGEREARPGGGAAAQVWLVRSCALIMCTAFGAQCPTA